MSNLDSKYIINLGLMSDYENEIMKFSMSDKNTSDFFVNIIRNYTGMNRLLSKATLTLYVRKPDGTYLNMRLVYNKQKKMYYCNLGDEFTNLEGTYNCQVAIELDGEIKMIRTKFKYYVEEDIPSTMINE